MGEVVIFVVRIIIFHHQPPFIIMKEDLDLNQLKAEAIAKTLELKAAEIAEHKAHLQAMLQAATTFLGLVVALLLARDLRVQASPYIRLLLQGATMSMLLGILAISVALYAYKHTATRTLRQYHTNVLLKMEGKITSSTTLVSPLPLFAIAEAIAYILLLGGMAAFAICALKSA
jgi:hypothetical protein